MKSKTDNFELDVFGRHSFKDKAIVPLLTERLRKDGLHLWFDEWVLEPGDKIQLIVKYPKVTDIEAEAMTMHTYYRRTLLQ